NQTVLSKKTMETKKSLSYLRAMKKIETLKGFYSHLAVYCIVNVVILLRAANVFNDEKIDFADWSNYIIAFLWGFGLVTHALYAFFVMKGGNNFLKRWEEKKIRQFLDEDPLH